MDGFSEIGGLQLPKEIRNHVVCRGYCVFVFYSAEYRDLIFQNGPYFMGPQGLYLNKWTFDPTQDVLSDVPVWVRLPHLPLHCQNSKSLETIGNKLGKYIDMEKRKYQYLCARICVEVYLEIGIPEAINLKIVEWSHIQEVDYEQLPFKCRYCHGYGHFARNCKKKSEEDIEKKKADQWTQVQKSGISNQVNRKNDKEGKTRNGAIADGKILPKTQDVENPNASSNHFVALSSPKVPIFEEGELQHFEVQDDEPKVNTGSMDQAGAANSELLSVGESLQLNHPSPNGATSSPSHA